MHHQFINLVISHHLETNGHHLVKQRTPSRANTRRPFGHKVFQQDSIDIAPILASGLLARAPVDRSKCAGRGQVN